MQRDMSMLRRVLLAVADDALDAALQREPVIQAHVALALEAGLVIGVLQQGGGQSVLRQAALTAQGQDAVALMRNEAIWQQVANRVAATVGDAPFSLWLAWLTRAVEAAYEEAR